MFRGPKQARGAQAAHRPAPGEPSRPTVPRAHSAAKPKPLALGEALAAAGGRGDGAAQDRIRAGHSQGRQIPPPPRNRQASKVLAHLGPRGDRGGLARDTESKEHRAPPRPTNPRQFGWLVRTRGWSVDGGPETAEKMLTTAFGPEKARALMRKASPESSRPFRFLKEYDAKELAMILKGESPQVLSSVILPTSNPRRPPSSSSGCRRKSGSTW